MKLGVETMTGPLLLAHQHWQHLLRGADRQGGIFRCIALDLPCNRFHELPATLYVAQIISGVLMPTRFGCKTAKARQHEF